MEKTDFVFSRNGLIILGACILLILGCVFFLGRINPGESGAGIDSERDRDYSRQMGLATELIGELNSGFGGVQDQLSIIADALGGDVTDLRSIATRIRAAKTSVEILEDDNARMRGLIRDYYSQLGDSSGN